MSILLVACLVLVGVGYYLLRLISGVLTVPKPEVVERTGRGELLVAVDGGDLRGLSIGPSSSFMAYVVTEEGKDQLAIRELSPGGREITRIPLEENGLFCWAPRPDRLVYGGPKGFFVGEVSRDGRFQVLRDVPAGSERIGYLSCSPDGRWMAWADLSHDPPMYRWTSLTEDVGGSVPYGYGELTWFPGGEAFVRRGGPGDRSRRLYRVDPITGREEAWMELEKEPLWLWVSREGRLFYLSDSKGWGYGNGLMVVSGTPGGREEKVLYIKESHLGGESGFVAVGPSGDLVAYEGKRGLEILDLEGERLYVFPEITGVREAVFHPSGRQLFFIDERGIWRLEL
ncbi:MAG: hypothetical protein WHT46_02015 [Candidatus Geothermincolales bacterium]